MLHYYVPGRQGARPLKSSHGACPVTPLGAPPGAPLGGDRPKWGVNRPGTQYRTQSEKDPNYQQRLQRLQRLHQRMLRHLRTGTHSCGSHGSCSHGSCSQGTVQFSELDPSRCVRVLDMKRSQVKRSQGRRVGCSHPELRRAACLNVCWSARLSTYGATERPSPTRPPAARQPFALPATPRRG